jgi:hypothetical protein
MDVQVALLIAEFVATHGLDAAVKVINAIGKDTITVEDWTAQKAEWDKSSDDFLVEAKARAGK